MGLQIDQEQQGAVRILALSGRLDTETATDLELAIQDLLGAGEQHFLVDLTNIGYVSSAGLRVLLGTAKQLEGGKGTLRLCGLNPSVTQVFDVAGFTKLFAIFSTRAAALGKHPAAKADAQLARDVANLIGAGEAPASNPKSGDIARSAAQLLGAKPAPATEAPKAKLATPPPPPRQAPKRPTPPEAKPGLLGKLRGLFGGK